MRFLLLAACLTAAGCATTERAPVLSPEDQAKSDGLFISSVTYPAYLTVCDARIPGYRARNEPAYERWRLENAVWIAVGERKAMAYLARAGKSPEREREWATESARRLADAPQGMVDGQCRYIAERMSVNVPAAPFQTLERAGSPVGRQTTDRIVARTAEQWAAAAQLIEKDADGETTRPGWQQRLPAVDFSRSMVVGIALPTHSDSCTGVTITGIAFDPGPERLIVNYRERKPRPDGDEGCALSFLRAYHFVTLPNTSFPVDFVAQPPEFGPRASSKPPQ